MKLIKLMLFMVVCLLCDIANGLHGYIYVLSQGSNHVIKLNVSESGLVQPFNEGGEQYPTVYDPEDMGIYNNNRNLYTLGFGSNKIEIFNIESKEGKLIKHENTVETGTGPWSVSMTPDEKCAYVGNSIDNTVSQYKIESSDGGFDSLGFVKVSNSPGGIKSSADGKFIFIAFPSANKVKSYKVKDSCEIEDTGYSIDTPINPERISRNGNTLYVACKSSAQIGVYSIDEVSGSLSKLQEAVTSGGVSLMSMPINNGYLYANHIGSNQISYLKINESSSLPRLYSGIVDSNGYGPRGLVFDGLGKHAYEINQYSNSITMFNVNESTGELTYTSKLVPEHVFNPFGIAILNLSN